MSGKRFGQRETLNHVLLIEEAHNVLSKTLEAKDGVEGPMEGAIRQVREFGQAVICVDQEPQKLSASILANTSTKIAFRLGNGAFHGPHIPRPFHHNDIRSLDAMHVVEDMASR